MSFIFNGVAAVGSVLKALLVSSLTSSSTGRSAVPIVPALMPSTLSLALAGPRTFVAYTLRLACPYLMSLPTAFLIVQVGGNIVGNIMFNMSTVHYWQNFDDSRRYRQRSLNGCSQFRRALNSLNQIFWFSLYAVNTVYSYVRPSPFGVGSPMIL